MKLLLSLVILGVFVYHAHAEGTTPAITTAKIEYKVDCEIPPLHIKFPKEWNRIVNEECYKTMNKHIQNEFEAALTYMAMGAHFSQDTVNRPGFADFFFKSASEEREHAIKFMDYMSMRGRDLSPVMNSTVLNANPSFDETWNSGIKALESALKLEGKVTKSIREIIVQCDKPKENNEYHLVDYLIGEFLDEQYKGQRDLAGKMTILSKLVHHQGSLGEFIFDKKLLNGEV